eukprot:jgi/Chlat1/4042/Chrsp26S08846
MALKAQLGKFQQRQHQLANQAAQHASADGKSAKPAPPAASQVRRVALAVAPAQTPKPYVSVAQLSLAHFRKAPISSQIKSVLQSLFEAGQALTPEEIHAKCGIDVDSDPELTEAVRGNVKIAFDGFAYEYKSTYSIKDKNELVKLLRKAPEGIPFSELKDSYRAIADDMQVKHSNLASVISSSSLLNLPNPDTLKLEGQLYMISNSDTQEFIVFPNEPKVAIKVDLDIADVFRKTELPREPADLERELAKAGMKPASSAAHRALSQQQKRRTAPKERKRRESKRTKFTNAHMPELFAFKGPQDP